MGILKLFKPKIEERSYSDVLSGCLTFNGIASFSNSKAMQLSTVNRAVNLISNSIAQMPIDVKKGDAIYKESLYYKMMQNPCIAMSRYDLISAMVRDMLLSGNAFALIREGKLVYIPSANVTNYKIDERGNIYYSVTQIGNVYAKDLIHIKNIPDSTGLWGVSTLYYATNALENSNNQEKMSNNFFGSGGALAGILKASSTLSEQQKKDIKASWINSVQNDANGIAVLGNGLDYQAIKSSPKESQLLESRLYQVSEIARYFNVSPLMLYDLSGNSYSSSEAAMLQFLTDCLAPIIAKFEAEFNRKLFPNGDGYVDFDESVLLRTDKNSESNYYKTMVNCGLMTPNEVRSRMGLEAMPGGDNLMMQINMGNLNNNQFNKDEDTIKEQ